MSQDWLKFLFRSNLVTWIIPFIGFFTSTATYSINAGNHGQDRTKYIWFARIGFVLSFINSAIGTKLLSH